MAGWEECLSGISSAIDELHTLNDTYFTKEPLDKRKRLEAGVADVLGRLDEVATKEWERPPKRAQVLFLRGKALDVMPEYTKEAEDCLAKAVKLEPGLAGAWLSLGNCFWKKGDLPAARSCFEAAQRNGASKVALRQLSMLERSMAKGVEGSEGLVEESIQHAKDAVALDVTDGLSWYTLGNAYLTHYFATGGWDLGRLRLALKAYQNAERDAAARACPDLHFNSAVVCRYLEEYGPALTSFAEAARRDPGLNAEEQISRVVKLLSRLVDVTACKAHVKPKKLGAITTSLRSEPGPSSHQRADLGALAEGANAGKVVLTRLLLMVPHDTSVPLCYSAVDQEGGCFVLSVYTLRDGALKEGDTLSLLDPCLVVVAVEWEGKSYSFRSIRIDRPQQILVSGRPLRAADYISPKTMLQAENVAT